MAVTLTPKDKNKLPDWARSTVDKVEAQGLDWEFDPLYKVPPLGEELRVQIRNEEHLGQTKEIILYAEAMKRGDQFPPGVISKDGYIVDFNTRHRALLRLGWPTYPMVVVQKGYANADPFTEAQFRMLGASFNTRGPKPLTRNEIAVTVREAAKVGWDTNRVSRDLGITRVKVQSLFAQFRAEDRAQQLGVSFNGTVNDSTRAMLGHRSEKLADQPFREIVRLVQDSGVTGADAAALVKRVVGVTTGDNDRLTIIATERAALDQMITRYQASGKRKRPLSIKARTNAEFFVEHGDKIGDLIDTNPNTREESLATWSGLVAVASQLVSAQQQANESVEV